MVLKDTSPGKTTSDRLPIYLLLGLLTQLLCAILFPKVKRRTKESSNEYTPWYDPDGVSFLYIQVASGAMDNGMYFGSVSCWWKTLESGRLCFPAVFSLESYCDSSFLVGQMLEVWWNDGLSRWKPMSIITVWGRQCIHCVCCGYVCTLGFKVSCVTLGSLIVSVTVCLCVRVFERKWGTEKETEKHTQRVRDTHWERERVVCFPRRYVSLTLHNGQCLPFQKTSTHCILYRNIVEHGPLVAFSPCRQPNPPYALAHVDVKQYSLSYSWQAPPVYWHIFCVLLGTHEREDLCIVDVTMRDYKEDQSVAKVSLPFFDWGIHVASLVTFQSHSVVNLSMDVSDDTINLLVGRGVRGCVLPTVAWFKRTFTTGNAKPGDKQCVRINFISRNFPCLGEEF